MGRYTNPQAYLPGPTAGILFHVFLSPHTSVRVDVRENVLFNHWAMRHELHVALGLALAWGGDER
jgi:hypothetical protein